MDRYPQGQYHGSGQLPYPKNTDEADQMMGNPSRRSGLTSIPSGLPMLQTAEAQLARQLGTYQQMQQRREQVLSERLKFFWANQTEDMKRTTEFKSHSLPLARVKKIMKADEDVKMISAEAPIVFAKACEMFILELTLRSWYNSEENKRRTLQRSDVTAAIARTDIYDFLVDLIPKEEARDETLFSMPRTAVPVPAVADSPSYYHVQPQQPAQYPPQQPAQYPRTPGDQYMNRPVMDPDLFRRHIPYVDPTLWYPQAQQQQQPPQSPSDS